MPKESEKTKKIKLFLKSGRSVKKDGAMAWDKYDHGGVSNYEADQARERIKKRTLERRKKLEAKKLRNKNTNFRR
tara:strand:+ start:371 stop:595 length:225 start_codon:yes stop_codon:yes gene_type:complete